MVNSKVLLTVERKPTEQLRVHWSDWNGRRLLNIRVWWRDDEESDWKPGKGITLKPEEAQAVSDALNKIGT